MKELSAKIKEVAAQSLALAEVELVIGWQKGDFWWQSYPVFIEKGQPTDQLTWDPFCTANLGKYLLEEMAHYKKIALFVKGCDLRGINQMIQDKRLDRSRLLLFGLPCPGMVDPVKLAGADLEKEIEEVRRENGELVVITPGGEERLEARDYLYEKCLSCRYPNPVDYDQMLAPEVEPLRKERFEAVSALEKLSPDERYDFWTRHFSRCLRCFACRNICPACNCRECVFDLKEPRWLGKATEMSETAFYHLIRAYHVAGRCIDCGECSRACPVGIPLTELNRKLMKDIEELYGEYEAGLDTEAKAPLITYKTDDPAAFTES